MEDLKIIDSLDSLLVKVADALGIGIDMVQANGMEYILKYGEYTFWSKFSVFGTISLIVSLGLIGLFTAIFLADGEDVTLKGLGITVLVIFVVIGIILLISALPYIMSPEMYSIKQAIKLLK